VTRSSRDLGAHVVKIEEGAEPFYLGPYTALAQAKAARTDVRAGNATTARFAERFPDRYPSGYTPPRVTILRATGWEEVFEPLDR
jgi:hypothetical protein